MKKINNLAKVFLLLVLVSINGCQKEQFFEHDSDIVLDRKEISYVEVKDGMLYFKTIADYESTIEFLLKLESKNYINWEEDISFFNSMRRQLNEKEREALGIEDDLFATMINPNGFIHIGDNIFQVDIINGIVLAVKASDYNTNQGSNLNVFNTKTALRTFSIEDDILSIIEGKETENTQKSSYCGSKKKGYYYINTHNGYEVKYKIVYQKRDFIIL